MSDRTAYQADATGSAPTILQSVLRRWPLVLIGLVAGGVAGVLGYLAQSPTYQSAAQLQVIKRDNARANDVRFGYVDDYVSTQLELLKSQRILEAAAKLLIDKKEYGVSPEFRQQLEGNPWAALKFKLTATRSRETGGTGTLGNSIVNLTFNGDNRRDTQAVLEAVIDAYKNDLKAVTKTSQDSTVEKLRVERQSAKNLVDAEGVRKKEFETRQNDIAKEPPATITTRLTNSKADKFRIELQLGEVKAQLDAISKAGKDRTARLMVLSILSGGRKVGPDPTANTLEGSKLALDLKRKSLLETLGPDHQLVKEVDSQLAMVKSETARLNPDNPSGDIDELAIYREQLLQRKAGLDYQLNQLTELIREDTKALDQLGVLIPEMNLVQTRLTELNRLWNDLDTKYKSAAEAQLAETQITVYEASVLNKPAEGSQIGPVLLTWLLPGFFLGGLVGGGLALLLELRDKSFRSPAEIRERLGVPVIGHLPTIRTGMAREADVSDAYDPTLVAALRPKSVEAEAYRGVRAQVVQMCEKDGHNVIQITSPTPGDGKSTLAANLAISLAQSGKRTVLLDCDFRKPRVHKLFALTKPEVGLASVTNGDTALADAVRPSDIDNLSLLPCGPRPGNPAELLSSPKFAQVLDQLKAQYDFVIVDTPPLLAVSDPRVVAQRVSGVVLVFRITNKARPLAERSKELLTDMGASLLGVVVNGGVKSAEYGYGYSYGAGYNYTYEYDYQYAEGTDDQSKF